MIINFVLSMLKKPTPPRSHLSEILTSHTASSYIYIQISRTCCVINSLLSADFFLTTSSTSQLLHLYEPQERSESAIHMAQTLAASWSNNVFNSMYRHLALPQRELTI
jgi:hypothetical protein